MTDLARWQSRFAATLAQQRPEDDLLDLVSPVSGPAPTEGIDVYLGNTRNCRVRALHDIYPVCLRVLGADCFNAIAADYVKSVPSLHFDLNDEGHELPRKLARIVRENPAFATLPWLSDLAEFERLCHQVYYRPDDTPLDIGSILTDADPARLYPVLSRSIGWLKADWPVHLVWEAHQDDADPPSIRMDHRRCAYVIERRNFRAEPIPVSSELVDLLDACNQQLSVADMADRTDLSVELLGELRARGWLCGLVHAEEQDV